MKEIFINLTKYLRQSITFVSLKKSIRLFYFPFYYVIYLFNYVYNYWFKSPIFINTNLNKIKLNEKEEIAYYYFQKKNDYFLDLINLFYF